MKHAPMPVKLTIAFCERAYCFFVNRHSLPDMQVRDNLLRKAGLLSRGGRGTSAPHATGQDIVRMTLGQVCSWQAKDVVEGYRKVSRFQLVSAREENKADGSAWKVDPLFPVGSTLEDVLHASFRHQASSFQAYFRQQAVDRPCRVCSLQVDHSPVEPRAYFEVKYDFDVTTPTPRTATWVMTFAGPPEVSEKEDVDVVEYSTRIRDLWMLMNLYGMVEGLSLECLSRDDDPSAATDGPDRFNEEQFLQHWIETYKQINRQMDRQMDRHGAPTPKRSNSA
jgi:hypothetical protein